MSVALMLLTLLGVAFNLLLVFRLSADMHDIRAQLGNLKRNPQIAPPVAWAPHHHHMSLGKGYFALWRWQDRDWKLVPGIVPPGARAGSPPKESGQCTGETRKVWVSSAKP